MELSKQMVEWREQVRKTFNLYELKLTDEQIDYCFLSSPNRAKRVLTDIQFNQYITMFNERF